MNRITMSDTGSCAQAKWCFPFSSKKEIKQKWIKENDLFRDDTGRIYALVDTASRVFFMDVVTGSLYQFGGCISSSTLKAPNMKRDINAGDELLFRRVTDEVDV